MTRMTKMMKMLQWWIPVLTTIAGAEARRSGNDRKGTHRSRFRGRRRDRSRSPTRSPSRDCTKRKKSKSSRKRHRRCSPSSSGSDSDSSSDDEHMHAAFSGALSSVVHPKGVDLVKERKYVHFSWATSYAMTKKKKLILPSTAMEVMEAVAAIGQVHAREFPLETQATNYYHDEMLLWSKVMSLRGLFLCDFWCRGYFAENKTAWHPIPVALASRLMILFCVHRLPDVYKSLCFACGDPMHRQQSCPFFDPSSKSSSAKKNHSYARGQQVIRPGLLQSPSFASSSSSSSASARGQGQGNVGQCRDFLRGQCSRSGCKFSR